MVTGSTPWQIEEHVSKNGKNMETTVVRTLGMKAWREMGWRERQEAR